MEEKFFIEVHCQQKSHAESRVCGDVFISRRIREEGRIIVVLSDGMGHGIKANILATLASTLAVNFTRENKTIQTTTDIIRKTLPVDSVRQMNYATFTIVDIDLDGEVRIMEYENPKSVVMRGARIIEPSWTGVVAEKGKSREQEILVASFRPQKEDRIIFCTDGVIQSGLGSEKYPMGFGQENLELLLVDAVKEEHDISAVRLSSKVIDRSNLNDDFNPKDDISCAVVYFREPRKLMICTGPPQDPANDAHFCSILRDFEGRKIICGATTGDMVAREWNRTIADETQIHDSTLPPASHMEGVDLVTEGILTLSRVSELLKKYSNNLKLGKGPADEIVKMILECDEIHFLAGTSINIAHQDPTLPVELELRRTVVHRIARTLEEKFLKETSLRFF